MMTLFRGQVEIKPLYVDVDFFMLKIIILLLYIFGSSTFFGNVYDLKLYLLEYYFTNTTLLWKIIP